jgi:hypothetical protein
LQRTLGSAEFEEWKAFSQIEPFGERRADARTWALIAHTANMVSDPAKSKPVDISKILTEWTPPQDPADVSNSVARFFEMKIVVDKARAG